MIKVLKSGLYSSIQDLGRQGYRKYGVPIAGAMDIDSAKLSNFILENEVENAVLEITLQGPRLQFFKPTNIAITGAKLSPTKNETPVEMNTTISIQQGDIIDFGPPQFGVRSYIAVTGGFQTEVVFGSRSFYKEITKKDKIDVGDTLNYHSSPQNEQSVSIKISPKSITKNELIVLKGPEFELLNEKQRQLLFSTTFTIGMNNRMGYQIKETIPNNLKSILSSAVLPGTIQLTPSGKMIILMRDCQTTGGYPRILQLSEASINHLAQKKQFENINFSIQ